MILDDHPEGCHALLSGQITAGDTDRLRAAIPPGKTPFEHALHTTRLCFNSPGGSFPVGLDLAAYARETGISTHVAAGDRCLSACALAFLGGTQFWVEDGLTRSRSRSMHVSATLGFHAPHLVVPTGQFSETVVRQAFDVAIRASGEIFGSLEELRITREFALSFCAVSGHGVLYIDTADRARALGGGDLTSVGALPERIDNARVRDICIGAFPSMDPDAYKDPNGWAAFAADWIIDLTAPGDDTRTLAYLAGTTAEAMLMIEACRLKWQAPASLTVELFRDIEADRGSWEDPQPPSTGYLQDQLSARPASIAQPLPTLAAPIGTRLSDLADLRRGVTDRWAALGTCAPIARSYRVERVRDFSNMRAGPGFDQPVLAEVPKGQAVMPLEHDLDGAAILSDACKTACHPSRQGILTAAAISAITQCARSNDVWWQVRTASGTEGWMSSSFLAP